MPWPTSCCMRVPEKLAIQMTCCTSKYCSEPCMEEAKETYHDVICGKDFSWLYKACKEADQIYSDRIPLMLVKILATAVHLNCKPLKVPCVRTLKANYDNVSLSKFTLFDNIVTPIQILETLRNRGRLPFLINNLLGDGTNRKDQTYSMRSLVHRYRLFLRLSSYAFAQRPLSLLVPPSPQTHSSSHASSQVSVA